MASKKAVKKGVSSSTAIQKWDAELAAQAAMATAVEENVGIGAFIGTAGGILKYKGGNVPDNKMRVVILDHILENALYEGKYDPANPTSPICFAFGRTEETMVPHADSVKPQAKTCAECPHNEWGSADTGKGKNVKNTRRLALVPEGDLEDLETAEVAYIKVPPTSLKGWAGFVRSLSDNFQKPPSAFVTELALVPDTKNQFMMTFKMIEPIEFDQPLWDAMQKKKVSIAKEIEFPYQKPTAPVAGKARGNGRGGAGTTARGSTAKKSRRY